MELINLYYQLGFLFLFKGIDLFYEIFDVFVLFLIHDEYGIGLNVDFPSRSTS